MSISSASHGSGFSVLVDYLSGSNPRDPNSKPRALLTIPDFWAVYLASNSVQVTANILSTNPFVTVIAALRDPDPTVVKHAADTLEQLAGGLRVP